MTPEEHNWLATVHKNLTVLDGRNPIGLIYTRMAMGRRTPPLGGVGHRAPAVARRAGDRPADAR